MNLIEIPHTGRKLYMPSDLSECDSRQYIEMSALILKFQGGQISYEDLRVHAVYYLLNLKRTGPRIDENIKFSNIYQLSLLIDSFFSIDEDGRKIIKQHYIHNPVPSFNCGLHNYYGPSDGFDNVSFGEYVDGLNHFIDFHETGELRFLYMLLATFYRTKKRGIFFRKLADKHDGDIRSGYNVASVYERATHFEKLHIGVVYGFYLLFASFQLYLTTAVLTINGKEIDLSVLFDSPSGDYKESELPGLGLKSMMYTFSESSVFGTLEQVKAIPLWEAFLRMYDLIKKNKDYEANQKK